MKQRIRSLDVIEVEKRHDAFGMNFDYVGVYLGNNKVCHFYDYRVPDKYMKARVDDIKVFLGNTENTSRSGRAWVYHPIYLIKNYRKIARQVAWAEYDDYWEGRYDLANRNCEHLANMLVYGINYLGQVERNEGEFVTRNIGHGTFGGIFSLMWHGYSINNGKSTLKLTSEINGTNDKLGYSRSDHWRDEEVERQYLQEIPPKENCRIM